MARTPAIAVTALALCGCGPLAPEDDDVRVTRHALQAAYTVDNASTVASLMAPLQESSLRTTIEGLVAFPTRLHDSETGKQASVWIRDRWQGYAGGRAGVTVKLIDHDETPQQSVALTIEGSKYPDERVILGGHLDSINLKGGAAPGADDNASGIACLDDVAHAALELGYQPERTVIFYAYAAEEIGLVGSDEIAAKADDEQQNIVAVLQLDMTNYNPSPTPYLAIVTDFTDAKLNQFAEQLIETYVQMPWKPTECGYACSDHGSWQKRGFPAHYVHESTVDESNDKIHTAQDTLALSGGSAQHSLHFARYAAAFMAEVAKGSIPPPPECTETKPCPGGGTCQAGSCVPSAGGAAGVGGAAGSSGSGSGGTNGFTAPDAVSGSGGAPPATAGGPTTVVPQPAAASPGPEASDAGCACRAAPQAREHGGFWLGILAGAGLAAARRRRTELAA